MKNKALLILSVIATISACTNQQPAADQRREQYVDSLLSIMTLDEKLGQLNLPVTGDIITGQAQSSNIASQIREGKVGGLFNLKGVDQIREVQRIAVEESRLGIPLLFGMDVIHGYETIFPIPLAVAATWNPSAAETMARVSAIEASADGICWTFSPMADVSIDARWGRVSEGFGEDPLLTGAMAAAMVKGYQQANLNDSTTIMACIKHFALYGAPEGGKEYNNVEMSRYRMYNMYFPAYKAAVDAGAASVMASFNTVEGIPSSANHWLLTELLRNQWGFNGMVVADYTAIQELRTHGMAHDKHEAGCMALKAGLDMDMVSEAFLLLNDDPTLIPFINQACRRILLAKYDLGLFTDPYRYCNPNRRQQDILTDENRAAARKVARESLVLLKNDNHTLPLSKNQTIALIGPLANTRANMSGTWAVAAVSDKYKTLKEGLEDALQPTTYDLRPTTHDPQPTTHLLYAKGSNLVYDAELEARATMFGREMRDNRSNTEMLNEALNIARKADVIVCAMGESSEYSGECASRTDLSMPDAQHDLLIQLTKLGKPIVLLNFSGRPVVLNWENEHLDAILQVWFAGSETADAIADILFGDYNPSGKLPIAFPRSVGQLPMSYQQFNTSRAMPENYDQFLKYISSYIDCRTTPLYPFGYGLNYSTLEYSALTLSDTIVSQNGTINASITITNSGNYDAIETVQLYIRDMVAIPVRPIIELKDWQRVSIPKGESQTVTFSIEAAKLGHFDNNGNYLLPDGDIKIMIGSNSRDLHTGMLNICQ